MGSNTDKDFATDSKMERNKEGAASGTTSDNKEKVQQVEGGGSDAENNAANVDNSAPAPEPELEPSTAARVPFTSLSQVDSDMVLARALQEQERAYSLLQMRHGFNDIDRFYYEGDHFDLPGLDEEDQDEGEEEDEDDDEDEEEEEEVEEGDEEAGVEERAANDDPIDGANFDDDEAFARALQDKEDRDTTARLMALAVDGDFETDSNDSEEGMWEDFDPDNMSYEELVALGEAVGTESKGLNPQSIAALEQFTYVPDSKESASEQDQCVVCRLEYEEGDKMLRLPCKHQYHSECIQQWLQRNKVCPVCSAEVTSESGTSESKS